MIESDLSLTLIDVTRQTLDDQFVLHARAADCMLSLGAEGELPFELLVKHNVEEGATDRVLRVQVDIILPQIMNGARRKESHLITKGLSITHRLRQKPRIITVDNNSRRIKLQNNFRTLAADILRQNFSNREVELFQV